MKPVAVQTHRERKVEADHEKRGDVRERLLERERLLHQKRVQADPRRKVRHPEHEIAAPGCIEAPGCHDERGKFFEAADREQGAPLSRSQDPRAEDKVRDVVDPGREKVEVFAVKEHAQEEVHKDPHAEEAHQDLP